MRALKYNGGVPKDQLNQPNAEALEKGLPNLLRHIKNITQGFGLPAVVAINRFPTDSEEELQLVYSRCKELGVNVALSEVWAKGSQGGQELAQEVIRLAEQPKGELHFTYDVAESIQDKIKAIATKIYGCLLYTSRCV